MARKTTPYGGDVVMFLPNKTIKKWKFNYPPKKSQSQKKTQYGGDVVMFLLNKIIKNNKNWIICKQNVGVAMPPKQPMVLLYMV